jgi:3-oxoacyl-[acyl-carrier protein] reductase
VPEDFFFELLEQHANSSDWDPMRFWDDRVPVDSVDKTVAQLLDLRGKKAVVTGGAGRNLGQACVNRLAGLGADVALIDLDPQVAVDSGRLRWGDAPDGEAVAKAASEKWDANVISVPGDIVTREGIESSLAECAERLGGIDILVNNAVDVAVGDFVKMGYDDFARSAQGTFVGPVYCTRVALDYMLPRGSGVIINVGSEASQTATPWLALYGALKLGLNGFTNFAGKELAKHGIRLVGVNPGCMWRVDGDLANDPSGLAAAQAEALYPLGRTAIQRFQLPEEVANMIAFLASDAASCMAGTMINMGGGMSL